MNAAVYGAPAEIHQKKMVLKSRWQAGARKIGHPRGTTGDIGNRRDNIGRLAVKMRVPEFLVVEWPSRIRIFHELIADAPATVAPFDDINPSCFIAAVRIVVTCEEIPVLIENQILRIAQPEREDLQLGAIGIATEHAA